MRKVNGSSKSTSPKTSKSKKKSRSRKMDIPVQYIAGGAVLDSFAHSDYFCCEKLWCQPQNTGKSCQSPDRILRERQ